MGEDGGAAAWSDLMGENIRMRVTKASDGREIGVNDDVVCSFDAYVAPEDASQDPEGPALFRAERIRFRLGEGEAVPCVELALRNLRVGSEALVFGKSRFAWASDGADGLPADCDAVVRLVVHERLEPSELSWSSVVRDARWRKENGNLYYSLGDLRRAKVCYAKGMKVFEEDSSTIAAATGASVDALQEEARMLVADVASNLAAVHLREDSAFKAKAAAQAAVQLNPSHEKALFRLAKSSVALADFAGARDTLRRAADAGFSGASFRKLSSELRRKEQAYKEKRRAMSSRMARSIVEERGEAAGAPAAGASPASPAEVGAVDFAQVPKAADHMHWRLFALALFAAAIAVAKALLF